MDKAERALQRRRRSSSRAPERGAPFERVLAVEASRRRRRRRLAKRSSGRCSGERSGRRRSGRSSGRRRRRRGGDDVAAAAERALKNARRRSGPRRRRRRRRENVRRPGGAATPRTKRVIEAEACWRRQDAARAAKEAEEARSAADRRPPSSTSRDPRSPRSPPRGRGRWHGAGSTTPRTRRRSARGARARGEERRRRTPPRLRSAAQGGRKDRGDGLEIRRGGPEARETASASSGTRSHSRRRRRAARDAARGAARRPVAPAGTPPSGCQIRGLGGARDGGSIGARLLKPRGNTLAPHQPHGHHGRQRVADGRRSQTGGAILAGLTGRRAGPRRDRRSRARLSAARR